MARFLTVGNLLVEDVVRPDGSRALGRLGGDALYAAIGARAFAGDVQPVVRLGRGFPDGLVDALRHAGFHAGLIPSDHDTIRLWVELGIDGGERFTFQSGTYVDATPVPGEIPAALTDGLEAVHVAPVPFARMEALVRWARPLARLLTVDPHYEHMAADWRPLLPLLDAFLPSRAEATALLGGWPGPERAVREIAALGARTVVIKLGTDGSVGLRGDELVRLPAATASPVDPTGCGDAFCGGFLVGFAETGDLAAAMAYGTVSAGLVAADHGAAHALVPDGEAARRRLERLRASG
ncbi:MAG TPA: carbohydrate kinase family protein [Gaiellaceae bacterium]|nr:carbohydrate kinase family protein [Gaiellaceae bacterium]